MRNFGEAIEHSVISLITAGKMTKDLAISKLNTNNVPRSSYLNTAEFIDAVAEDVKKTIIIKE